MRRYWIPILVLATVVIALLFFGDYLTGRVNREQQDPYSRARRLTGYHFGIPFDAIVPNTMSEYYFRELRQPHTFRWEASDDSYTVSQFSGNLQMENNPIAPVMFLKPEAEAEFLRQLSGDKLRLTIIHSLFQPRKHGTDKVSQEWNKAQMDKERDRVRRIVAWYELDRKDFSVSFPQWWRDNANVFGIQPDGTPLPPSAAPTKTTPLLQQVSAMNSGARR